MKTKLTLTLVVVALCSASFLAGGWLASKRLGLSMESMQAILSYGHWETYRGLQSDALAGCIPRVMVRLDRATYEQRMLMADHVQSPNDGQFEQYAKIRAPELLPGLRSETIRWDKQWELPPCNKE